MEKRILNEPHIVNWYKTIKSKINYDSSAGYNSSSYLFEEVFTIMWQKELIQYQELITNYKFFTVFCSL